jgi:hypothetical protein
MARGDFRLPKQPKPPKSSLKPLKSSSKSSTKQSTKTKEDAEQRKYKILLYVAAGVIGAAIIAVAITLSIILTAGPTKPRPVVSTTDARIWFESNRQRLPVTDGSGVTPSIHATFTTFPAMAYQVATVSNQEWDNVQASSLGTVVLDFSTKAREWADVKGVRLYIHGGVGKEGTDQGVVDGRIIDFTRSTLGLADDDTYTLLTPSLANEEDNVAVQQAWLVPGIVSTVMCTATWDAKKKILNFRTPSAQKTLQTGATSNLSASVRIEGKYQPSSQVIQLSVDGVQWMYSNGVTMEGMTDQVNVKQIMRTITNKELADWSWTQFAEQL